jgi:hypothetical protein
MNLENLNVQELNTEEMKNVDGGLSLKEWANLKAWGDQLTTWIDGLELP